MLIYEVNLKVNPEVEKEFLAWLKTHMHEVVECGRFESAKLFTTEEGDLTVHYYVKDRTALDAYLKNHAPRLRENGLKAFPNQFTATRRILGTSLKQLEDALDLESYWTRRNEDTIPFRQVLDHRKKKK